MKIPSRLCKPYLDDAQFKLYELIWKRFVACQMESARLETTTVNIKADEFLFKSSGTTILFDGFLTIYDETTEETVDENGNGTKYPPGWK
jgi:DNA topoisomerase-1